MLAQTPWIVFPQPLTWMLKVVPGEAVLDRNEAAQELGLQQMLTAIDVKNGKIFPGRIAQLERDWKAAPSTPYNLFTKLELPIYENILLRAATGDVAVKEARAACALERSRLANGSLPRDLAILLPADPLGDGPLHFVAESDGGFRLYSVGWNQSDDSGQIALKSGSRKREDESGDWVWRSSANSR